MKNITDSRQLDELRVAYLSNPDIELRRATPIRLGAFAKAKKIKITDFGAHSKRWIRLFEKGGLGA